MAAESAPALLAAASALADDLSVAAPSTWSDGVSATMLGRLAEAGLLDPFAKAGPSDAAMLHLELPRLIAQYCASTAWIVAAAGQASAVLQSISAAARPKAASGPAIAFATYAVDVGGTWRAVPAATTAAWFVLADPTQGPSVIVAARDAVRITPLDHRGGLHGAGLGNLTLINPDAPRQAASVLDANAALTPAAVALGAAEGAFRDYVTGTRRRVTSTAGGAAVAKFTQVQVRLAGVDAELEALRGMFQRLIAGDLDRTTAARDAAYIAQRSLAAATQLVQQMGAQGIAESNSVQRHVRDLRAAATDPRIAGDAALAARGRALLGLPDVPAAAQS